MKEVNDETTFRYAMTVTTFRQMPHIEIEKLRK